MRTVLDTNTVLSALLFESGRLTWIRDGWIASRFVPLCSAATAEELIRVLAYPKFRLDEDDIRVLLGSYIGFAEVVHITPTNLDTLPRCRDPNDQMFLELAICGDADVLVTGDDDLIEIAEDCELTIETPAEFKKRFD
ncbi:MAG: putative toxin-antitoxin system toxin component, PIN family [Acidobacteriota bacterium]|nr:MAG: putative toxin-antitoxin system toxin component, PIN family [Acidobacteriota bacterium]